MIDGKRIKNNGEYIIFEGDKAENVNPVDYFQEMIVTSSFGFTHAYLTKYIEYYKLPISEQAVTKVSLKEASQNWNRILSKIKATEISVELIEIFNSSSKKEQIKLLKNLKINSDILLAFIFRAWTDYNFAFSRYVSEHYPKNTEEDKLPKVAHIIKNKIEKVGETDLTDGQIKQVIENRKVIVSNFFDNKFNWFCLFVTYESLKGKEGWKNGTPHYHFISDKFGISKEKVIAQLNSKEYKLGSLPHIEIDRKR
ncbi:hypothetical protein A1704_17370 [Chryseobacterium cucumeris]|uniref:hypothetical protein n=1 Tax=Chryseobacterium cucumeris TaxID=1813611 RepID=UPI000786E883|nr:hypothetical protein [Chryseobacterium cucumeris]KYH04465.1 hypothetical protein A1704_17370 [Chryseobacterium cucumeris]